MKTGTIKELLDAHNGIAPGFDALRLILAFIIMLWHSFYVCYGLNSPVLQEVREPLYPIMRGVLPAFFCLGGFLVTGSAYRLRSVKKFFFFRFLRIVPALLVEVTLSALFLGAVLTTLPLHEYFTHSEFYKYFLNIIGNIHYTLPGVDFAIPGIGPKENTKIVNINLWTLPPDFEGYAIMMALLYTGVIFNRKVFLGVLLLVGIPFILLLPLSMDWGGVMMPPKMLIFSFFVGVAAYVFADRIPIKKTLMMLSILSLVFFVTKYTTILGVLGACYLTLCLGFLDLRNFPLVHRGDYSYGIYLYGFPIERIVWYYMPFAREWWLLFIIAFTITLIFSVLSWHFIEKPALNLKRKIR